MAKSEISHLVLCTIVVHIKLLTTTFRNFQVCTIVLCSLENANYGMIYLEKIGILP